MAQAWMVRSGEQQKFLDSLVEKYRHHFRSVVDIEEGQKLTKNFLIGILKGFEGEGAVPAFALWSWLDHQLRNFARAPEEYEALKWRFFMKVAENLGRDAEYSLTRLEVLAPQKIFEAPSATAEVDV